MQMEMFAERRRGGRPKKKGAGVSHLARPVLAPRFPVHVTLRVRRDVGYLRTRRCFSALKRAFYAGGQRERFRLVGYSVQADHLHFLVEGADREALSRGMQGLNIRMARALNRTLARRGKVFADRYHARILRTPTEVANARTYVLRNHAHHFEQRRGFSLPRHFTDHYADITPATARTWLLREGWRRATPQLPSARDRC